MIFAALQDDRYGIIRRYARQASAKNWQAFQSYLLATQRKYLQHAMNLQIPTQAQAASINLRRDFLLGALPTSPVPDKLPFPDAKTFYECAGKALDLQLDAQGNIISQNKETISGGRK